MDLNSKDRCTSVDMFYRIVSLLGGLSLFLYGMRTMGDGLKNGSGNAMRLALKKVTDRPIKGFILGMLITCVIQSSTACIVLTVGLVGAGFLTFRQSIGVVLGAEVGDVDVGVAEVGDVDRLVMVDEPGDECIAVRFLHHHA